MKNSKISNDADEANVNFTTFSYVDIKIMAHFELFIHFIGKYLGKKSLENMISVKTKSFFFWKIYFKIK